MRIAVICEHNFHKKHVGVRSLTVTIVAALRAEGCEVSFVVCRPEGDRVQWLIAHPDARWQAVNFIDRSEYISGSAEEVARLYAHGFFEQDAEPFPPAYPITYYALGSDFPEDLFDAAVITAPWMFGLQGRLPVKWAVGIVHDTIPNTFALNGRDVGGFAYDHVTGFRYYVKYCDAVWTNSRFTAEAFRGFCRASKLAAPYIAVLPPVVPHQIADVPTSDHVRDNMIIAVGLLDWRKGLREAPAILNAAGRDAHLVLCSGIRCEEEGVREFLSKLDVNRVTWYRSIKAEKLSELYARAKVLLFNSDAEGLGLPVVEAQAAGCRALTSDHPALLEVLLPGSVGVSRATPKWFENNLKRMMSEPFDYQRLAQKARQVFSPSSLQKMICSELTYIKTNPPAAKNDRTRAVVGLSSLPFKSGTAL